MLLADADSHLETAALAGPESLARAGLDLHEGIEHVSRLKCSRWPESLRLESTLGLLVEGRCKAVNLCDYCARLAAIETAEVLALDALVNEAPAVWSVLTTRTASMDVKEFQAARKKVRQAVKRKWPAARSACMVEMTSGLGQNSGGKRRPHWNDLWKGIPTDDVDELRELVARIWCRTVDAEAPAQYAGTVRETNGLMRYLALHFQKESQAPPKGWRGHRFRAMKGYLGQPMEQARAEARQSLRLKREIWKAEQAGLEGAQALEAAQTALYEANELAWSLVRLQRVPTAFDGEGLPCSWVETVVPV